MNDLKYRSWHIGALAFVAYVTVLVCLAVVVWKSDISEYAQGVITLVLGKYLSNSDQVFAFYFNTTRTSVIKDATISALVTPAPTPPKELTL